MDHVQGDAGAVVQAGGLPLDLGKVDLAHAAAAQVPEDPVRTDADSLHDRSESTPSFADKGNPSSAWRGRPRWPVKWPRSLSRFCGKRCSTMGYGIWPAAFKTVAGAGDRTWEGSIPLLSRHPFLGLCPETVGLVDAGTSSD